MSSSKDRIVYTELRGNRVILQKDEYGYEVSLNGAPIIATDNENEAQLVAESLDIALSILEANKILGSIGDNI